MAAPPSAAEQELESLTQFLYMAPIGLVQASIDGEILLINPKSAQLLMPLAPRGELTNLFDVFEELVPDLRLRTESHGPSCGLVCEGLPLRVAAERPGRREPQVLSLTLLKLDASRLMAVVDDISAALSRDAALRRSRSWIGSFVAGTDRYALLPLDRDGRVTAWNERVAHLTGFDAERSVGRPHSLFQADAEGDSPHRLERADREGWSLDDGWHRRADGSRYWGSSLVVPTASGAAEAAYHLVIRDLSGECDAGDALPRGAGVDHLTGLADRWAFFEAAEAQWRRAVRAAVPAPLALVVFDLDPVSTPDDRAALDAALRHVASHLAAAFETDALTARIGSARFAVLVPRLLPAAVQDRVERACRAIADPPLRLGDAAPTAVTVQAGVATLHIGAAGIDDLLRRADAALRRPGCARRAWARTS